MKITIKKCRNGECDGDRMSLFVDDVHVFSGDYYHDKIEAYIDGFISAIKHLSIEHTIEYTSMDCIYDCY